MINVPQITPRSRVSALLYGFISEKVHVSRDSWNFEKGLSCGELRKFFPRVYYFALCLFSIERHEPIRARHFRAHSFDIFRFWTSHRDYREKLGPVLQACKIYILNIIFKILKCNIINFKAREFVWKNWLNQSE